MPYQTSVACTEAKSVTINHAYSSPSSQRASNVHCKRLVSCEKQSTFPHQALPTSGAAVARLRNWPSPRGRKWPCLLIRMNGCHPSDTILAYNQGAYKPRSLITITVQCSGTRSVNFVSNFIQCGSQAPFCPAPTTFQATGMAQPRYTTLITSTVKRFESVVASKASASRG